MGRTIKLNESSFKKLLEYIGDEEEFGRYDIDDGKYDMSDDEFLDLQRMTAYDNEEYEDDMRDFIDGNEGYDEWAGRDFYDPSPLA